MATKEKARNIVNFLLNDIAEIFPLLFLFYAVTLLLSLIFESWKLYFNWPIFHVNILILGLFSFLSEYGRGKIFPLIHFAKTEIKKVFAWRPTKQKIERKIEAKRKKCVNVLGILCVALYAVIISILVYIISTIKKLLSWLIKIIIKIVALALDIRQQGFKYYLKFILLAVILSYAITNGANFIELLIWIYAFRTIFVGIDSRISAGIALVFLATSPILLIFKKDAIAEQVAVFAYYFLVIVVITQIIELRRESKTHRQ